jgi:V8-like Glu-specific endopeptidase
MVCSGTVITDVNHPGKSNLVWTAGHCVHAGGGGGWYRNIVFVPAYNDLGGALDVDFSAPSATVVDAMGARSSARRPRRSTRT